MKQEIFISYSRQDLKIVEEIKNEIESSTNTECWMDLTDIESGSEIFVDAILKGIDKCTVFLFMLSEHSQMSEYALKELKYAYKNARSNKEKHVVIVNINRCTTNSRFDFEYGLADTIDWLNITQHEKLIRDLCKWFPEDRGAHKSISREDKLYSEALSNIQLESDKFNCYVGRKVTPEMIYQAVCIDSHVFSDEFKGVYDTCIKWWKKNPSIYVMIEDCITSKIVGYINAMPLSNKYYDIIRSGETIDNEIPSDEIETYDFPDTYKLYFSSIAIHPDYHNTGAFKALFDGFIIHLLQLYEREIYFSSIVADAVTITGEKLCKYIGLKPILDSNHGSRIYEGELLPPGIRPTTILCKRLISVYQQL